MKKLSTKIIALCIVLIGLSAFLLLNLGQDNIPQIQAATASSGTITITNTGSTQTNYDILVTVDTASLISAGNMQADCDDIRLYNSDDSTALTYWLEGGCNTTTTQIWVTVPSIPNGTKTIYMHYNDPNMTNGEASWSGNFILMDNTTCPSGWTRNTSFDSRFPYGASSYGGTGGSSSHNHGTASCTSGGVGGSSLQSGSAVRGATGHSHTASVTINSTSNLPPYLNMIFCQKSDLDISSGLIALFDSSAPSGWTRFTALDSKFPQGGATYGGTGGTSSHSHTTTGGINVSFASNGWYKDRGSWNVGSYTSHSHTSQNGTTSSTSHIPPYLNMIFGSKNSTGVGSANMIAMFSALPPLGWTRFTALDSKFPQGGATYGGTGGASSHTHTTSISLNNSTGSGAGRNVGPSGVSYVSMSHSHSACTATTNSASNLPPYLNTIFAKRNNPSTDGLSTSISFDNSCHPGVNDTSHTIISDCSFSDSRGTDTNGKTVYGMDPGTSSTNTSALTVQAGTLTITSADDLAVGSISMTGGSIAIATGGKINPGGVIFYPDADGDGYPSSTTVQVAFTPPSGHRRRNLMSSTATTDCDDSNGSHYQNLTGYTDADGDGYGTGTSTQVCSGATLLAGYALVGNDCDDTTYSATNSCRSNYFGDGSDGAVTISANTNLTVPNKNGSYDGDMVVKNYSSLTINSGVTLTTDQPGRGLLIYVTGNATINGTLSMTARGASANPTVAGASDNAAVSSTGIRLPMLKSGSTETLSAADFAGTGNTAVAAVANQSGISGDGTIFTIQRSGASGGSGGHNGGSGGNGSTGQSGGGGGGAGYNASGGVGSSGTIFSGGTGGGGGGWDASGTNGITNGGKGGNGGIDGYSYQGSGGAGNPGGNAGGGGQPGQNGTGGLLILLVGGNLNIGSSGIISTDGTQGGNSWAPGGSSGGGNILILYAGNLTNNGSIHANGGAAVSNYRTGGAGGSGSVQGPTQVDVAN